MTATAPTYRDKALEPLTREGYDPRHIASLLNANRPVMVNLEPGDATCYTLLMSEHFYRGAHLLCVVRLSGGHPKWVTWVTVMPKGMPVPEHDVYALAPGDRYTIDVLTWYLSLIAENLNRPPF